MITSSYTEMKTALPINKPRRVFDPVATAPGSVPNVIQVSVSRIHLSIILRAIKAKGKRKKVKREARPKVRS